MASQSAFSDKIDRRLALLGDFGGTNARLGLADLSVHADRPPLKNIRHFHSREFQRPADVVAAWLSQEQFKPATVVIAAAGPVKHGAVTFTNMGWTLSESDLTSLGFSSARIVNDFVALALSAPLLSGADIRLIAEAVPDSKENICVVGPGTGFGASALIVDRDGRRLPLAAEAGHASFAPSDDVEVEILRVLSRQMEHVSIERVLSGPGLLNLHAALNAIEGVGEAVRGSEELTRRALGGEKPFLRTLERFCAILGSTAGDLALDYGALGGVYIAGGIAPEIIDVLARSDFRRRFESKGRLASYLRPVSTAVVVRPDAAFLGAAHIARQIAPD